jgi:hypothetical protein
MFKGFSKCITPPPSLHSLAWVVFICLWLFFGILINSEDQKNYTLQHAGIESLVERGTFSVSNSKTPELFTLGDTFEYQDWLLAAKQPGQFVIGAIPYFAISKLGISYKTNYVLASTLVVWFSSALLLALSARYFLLLLSNIWKFPIKDSLIATLGYALCTTLTSYVGVEHHDIIATSFLSLSLYLFESRQIREKGSNSTPLVFSGVLIGLALFTSMLIAPIALFYSLYCTFKSIRSPKTAWAPNEVAIWWGGVLLGLLPLALYNIHYFENPFIQANIAGNYSDTFFRPSWDLFFNHLYTYLSPEGDLSVFLYSPLLVIGILGALVFEKKRREKAFLIFGTVIFHLAYVLNIETVGHCQFGPRYLIPLTPFACLGIAPLISLSRRIFIGFSIKIFLYLTLIFAFFVNTIGALGGTMYCDIDKFAALDYLERVYPLVNVDYPLRQLSFLFLMFIVGWKLPEYFTFFSAKKLKTTTKSLSWLEHKYAGIVFSLIVATIYFFSNPTRSSPYDYTLRIAHALLNGNLGLVETPPGWLNEMVPFNGNYYSVFPLGAVASYIPIAELENLGFFSNNPTSAIVAVLGFFTCILTYSLARHFSNNAYRALALATFISLGTWHWCNLASGGAWQIAIGFAVCGELAALYFILVNPLPLIAGLFFSVAFGNRTEIILVFPIFIYLLIRDFLPQKNFSEIIKNSIKFSAIPLALGILTLFYNYKRFGTPFDFGYARIPGVLDEPWYRDGIFSLSSIKGNFQHMLLYLWKVRPEFPYFVPSGFGESILVCSPFLALIFRPGYTDKALKLCAWGAIVILVSLLWIHGNPGGWQFSYRYAAICLPWALIILIQSAEASISKLELGLLAISVVINAYATYLFYWTQYVQP